MAGFIDIVTNDTDENGVTTERRIHLNNPDGIFHIREWKPQAPPPEDLYQFSPFEDGRVLAMRKYGNVADEWTMDASGPSGTATDQELQALRAILKKAVDYWIVDWQTEPVWLEMMGDGESNIRYSYIYAWDIPEESNPFSNPRNVCPSLIPEWPLRIEHGFWLNSLAGECVELSNTQAYYTEQSNNFVPTASADDCYVDTVGGTINLNLDTIWLGRTAASAVIYGSGIRFRSVAIPQGAIITRAHLRLEAGGTQAGDNVNVTISADDVDNAAIFSTYANFAGRARTTANTAWSAIEHFTHGTQYDSPDIKAVIQEVVSRGGWASGNSLAILLDDNTSTANAFRSIHSWDHAPVRNTAILYVWWFDTTTGTFGQTATCNPVYFADRHNKAQLTHAFHYDDSTGTYSANLIGSALPYALFPAAPAVGDILYIGIDTALTDSGPFGSVAFDLSIADAGMAGAWEYWNGAWAAQLLMGNAQFTAIGLNSASWLQHTAWATTTINGITGYWVRFRVTAIGANCPTQQNRDIFTIITPFMDIASTEAGGDVAMLASLEVREKTVSASTYSNDRVIAGLRSLNRGLNFTAYINLADEQNPTGINIGPGVGSFVNDMNSPTGRAIEWNSGSTNWTNIGQVGLANPIAREYIGTFMTYLRMRLDAAYWHYQFKIYVQFGTDIIYESLVAQPEDYIGPGGDSSISICSFGEIGIPFDPIRALTNINIYIYGKVDNTAYNVWSHDFIMMPNDEWIGTYKVGSAQGIINYDKYLSVDPISQIKLPDVATIRDDSDGLTYNYWDDQSPHFPMLQERGRQRLWFFHPASFGGVRAAFPSHIGTVKINAIKKYYGSWG